MAEDAARRATPEELARKRAELARASRAGIWRFGRIVLMLVAFVAAVLFFTRDRNETDILSFPTDGNGERDAEYWIYRDGRGRALLEFEIPRNPKMILNVAPATNGFTAVSWLGLQRDVLYRMEFSATEDASELELDLLASARRWRDSMCGDGARWIFYDAGGDGLDANSRSSYQGILFEGGDVIVISTSGGDSSIDTEQGYEYTGGRVLALCPSGGMGSESTKCRNFNSVATKTTMSLRSGETLSVSVNGKTEASVEMPCALSALVIYLGASGASFTTE